MNAILNSYLDNPGFMVLDGGLATELETRGHDLNHPLWSARLLIENPGAILEVHRAYLEAGADCIISSSYQASFAGFAGQGLDRGQSARLLLRSVELALQARDEFLSRHPERSRPLVAASVGPYGAALADGSEYRGNYGIPGSQLRDFHAERWQILAGSGADLLACETIPSALEAEILGDLIEATPELPVWVSFSCADQTRIRDGSPLRKVVAGLAGHPNIVALGVNCTEPSLVSGLIGEVRLGAPGIPVVVYPNSGESYDGCRKEWRGRGVAEGEEWARLVREWHRQGARLIGGCCRTGPGHVRIIRRELRKDSI